MPKGVYQRTESFSKKRSEIQKMLWNDQGYRANQHEKRKGRKPSAKATENAAKAISGQNNPMHRLDVKAKVSKSLTGKPSHKQTPETRKKIADGLRGEKCHLWRGGKSYEPYCSKFTKQFRAHIRDKFNYKCFLCPSIEGKRKLSVHHIDYNKNSICNGNEWAFVALCQPCHMKTSLNRWYYFNLLINYWALNPDILIQSFDGWLQFSQIYLGWQTADRGRLPTMTSSID